MGPFGRGFGNQKKLAEIQMLDLRNLWLEYYWNKFLLKKMFIFVCIFLPNDHNYLCFIFI